MEQPLLLDPTVRPDVDLIDVNGEAMMYPSAICIASARERVEQSIERYGLNLPKLVGARKRVMRDIVDVYTTLMEVVEAGTVNPATALPVDRLVEQLRRTTLPDSPNSKVVRAILVELGAAALGAQPEDVPTFV